LQMTRGRRRIHGGKLSLEWQSRHIFPSLT
jgi:hypothetical protein